MEKNIVTRTGHKFKRLTARVHSQLLKVLAPFTIRISSCEISVKDAPGFFDDILQKKCNRTGTFGLQGLVEYNVSPTA